MRVIVVDYHTEWPELFEKESQKLAAIFKDELVDIHHIGSTSVEGLAAKPIIDILPVVKSIENVDALTVKMNEIGYEALGEKYDFTPPDVTLINNTDYLETEKLAVVNIEWDSDQLYTKKKANTLSFYIFSRIVEQWNMSGTYS